MTECLDKGEVEVRNSRQASGQRQTQYAYWWKRRRSWVTIAEGVPRRQPHRRQA